MSPLMELVTGGSSTERLRRKVKVFWDLAIGLSNLSVCRRLSVGAVILAQDLSTVLSIGFNGPPSGMPNDSCRDTQGNCGCIHAEANALVKLRTEQSGLLLIVTVSPCEHCAGLILNSRRIGAVLYGEEFRDAVGTKLIQSSGVPIAPIQDRLFPKSF